MSNGQASSLSRKFFDSVCMQANVGLYFHNPEGYPQGQSGWKRLYTLPFEDAWAWVQKVASHVAYPPRGGAFPNCTFGDLVDRAPDEVWPPHVAIVVRVGEDEILALYHDAGQGGQSSSFCVISLRL